MIFDTEFRPVQRENGFIKTLPKGTFFKVLYVEQMLELPPKNFGSIAANTNLSDQEYTDLYMNDNELGQYRLIPIDDVIVTVKQPLAMTRFTNKNLTGRISKMSGPTWSMRHNLSEVFVFEDDKVFLTINNPWQYVQQISRVQPIGFRFVLEEVKPVDQYVAVPVEGWRTT